MKISCDYSILLENIVSLSPVVEDTMSSEDMKNVIIKVFKSGEVVLIGVNQLITYRVSLPVGSYSITAEEEEYNDSDEFYMQVKCKEIVGFLNSFKAVRRTKITEITLENIKNKVRATACEEDLETGKQLYSHWNFDNIPVKPNLTGIINLQAPEGEMPAVDSTAILLYTSSLLPIMQNGSNLYSRMVFGEDKVVAFNTAFTTLMNNSLGDEFKGMCLSYRAVNFLKNLAGVSPTLNVAKSDQYLCIKTDSSEAFIRYDSRVADYSLYANLFKKDHAMVLDRQYFKDVLKRLSLVDDAVEFNIAEGGKSLVVKNSKFSQEIPIIQTKGMDELGEVAFKVLPDVLNKAIIGDDSQFSASIFVYLAPTTNGGYSLIFADDSGFWYSVASIR